MPLCCFRRLSFQTTTAKEFGSNGVTMPEGLPQEQWPSPVTATLPCHLLTPSNVSSAPPEANWVHAVTSTCLRTSNPSQSRELPLTHALWPIPPLPCTLTLSHISPHSSLKPVLTHIQALPLSSALVPLHSLDLTRGMQPELNLARMHRAGGCSCAQPTATPACASTGRALHHPGFVPQELPAAALGQQLFQMREKIVTESSTSSSFQYDFSPHWMPQINILVHEHPLNSISVWMKTSQLWTGSITTSDKYHLQSPARTLWFFPSLENSLGCKPWVVQNKSWHSLPVCNSNEQLICHYKMHYTHHPPSSSVTSVWENVSVLLRNYSWLGFTNVLSSMLPQHSTKLSVN